VVWRVYSDFDNTISLGDVTDAVLTHYAAPEWEEIEARWKRGEIGSRECMVQQFALVSASKAEIDSLADTIEIDPGFAEFAAFCAQQDIPLTIVSDGLDYTINRILARYGLDHIPVIAGHLAQIGERAWQLTAPNSLPICASGAVTCKCAAVQDNSATKIFYIGDGRSDFCVTSKRATLTLAKTSLLKYCQDQQLPHLPFHGFRHAIQVLRELIEKDKNNTVYQGEPHANRA